MKLVFECDLKCLVLSTATYFHRIEGFLGFLMFQGGSTLPTTYFTQRQACLRPWSGLESVPRNLADDDVNMPSHLGNAVMVTLRQHETYGNIINGINHVATSCAITVHGYHDNASRTKTLEAECAHYKSENGRLRRQAKQLELSKNHYHQMVLQQQRRASEWKRMEMNGNDSGLNLPTPSIHPLNIPPSTGGIRKPTFPCTAEAPLNTAFTELHESESNAPRRHPTIDRNWYPINVVERHEFANPRSEHPINVVERHEFANPRSEHPINVVERREFANPRSEHPINVVERHDFVNPRSEHPINVVERHEFVNPRLESALNNALHTPKGELAPDPLPLKGSVSLATQLGGPSKSSVSSATQLGGPSKGSVSSATQLGGPSADAATTRQPGFSLVDFWTGDVAPEAIKCVEDVKRFVANGAATQGHLKELGQRASPLPHRTQPGDLKKSDKKTRPSSDPDVYKKKDTGMDVQDAALLLITTFKDLVHAPITSKSTLSDAAGGMGDIYPPANCQAEEDITVNENPTSTSILSLASRATARGAMGRTQNQQKAKGFKVPGASTHSMICSYCSDIPCRKDLVALCKLCPRRFCLKCFRDAILDSNIYTGTLDSFTRTLLQGQQGDILVEWCPWCIQNRDAKFSLPPQGVSWMTHLLQELLRHDLSHCFREPVDTEKYPGYVQSVGRDSMMDLGTMMRKVKAGKYSSRRGSGQFIEDLRKIWKNCRKFAGCDDLGKPTEGDDLPGIARCALILEAMSTKFVVNHTSSNQVQWHPSAWDYHSSNKIREEEMERLRRVEQKKNTSQRKLIISRMGKGLKRGTSEVKRGDDRLGFYPFTNKRLRLETVGPSNDGEEDKSWVLRVGHPHALPRERSNSGHVSSVQQQADVWQPLEDLSFAPYSFSRTEKKELGNNVSLKIRRWPQ